PGVGHEAADLVGVAQPAGGQLALQRAVHGHLVQPALPLGGADDRQPLLPDEGHPVQVVAVVERARGCELRVIPPPARANDARYSRPSATSASRRPSGAAATAVTGP